MDELLTLVKGMKEQLDKQDEQIEYIVARLNHMRDKAHEKRESQTAWPKYSFPLQRFAKICVKKT